MSVTQVNGACPAILMSYLEAHKVNDPSLLVEPIGATEALFDPVNRRATRQELLDGDSGNGHVKTVRVWRKQRDTDADTQTTKSCGENGVEKPSYEDLVTPTLYREHTNYVTESAIRKLCDAYSQLVYVPGTRIPDANRSAGQLSVLREVWNEISLDFNAIRRAINKDILIAMATKYGKYVGGANIKPFTVYRNNDSAAGGAGAPVLAGFNNLRQEVSRSTFNGTPIIIGEGITELSLMALQYGCCNNGGVDFGKMAGTSPLKFYKDVDIATGTGSVDSFFAFMPDAMQFISYNEYVGSYARPIGIMERGTIADPYTPGLVYDMRILPDECSESYKIIIGLHFDLYAAPQNLFKPTDRLNGVNGIFKGLSVAV